MTRWKAGLVSTAGALALVPLLSPGLAITATTADAGPLTGKYVEVAGWPKLPPGVEMGETSAVDVDNDGHVFAFHRPGRGFEPDATALLTDPTVLEIDPDSGKLVRSWGANTFLVPHGLTIDRHNNVW